MSLKEIMHKPTFVGENMAIIEVAKIMAEKSIGSVLVGNMENVRGIFSERDLLVKIVSKGLDIHKERVSNYMTSPVKAVDINLSVFDAQNTMIENHVRRVPITNEGKVVGIVSARNIMEHLKYEYLKKRLDTDYGEREMYSTFW